MISRNEQPPTCRNAACRDQKLTIKQYPTRLLPMEGQQKEIHYPEWLKGTTGKELWSGEKDEVSKGNRDVWGNIKWGIANKCLIVIDNFDAEKTK